MTVCTTGDWWIDLNACAIAITDSRLPLWSYFPCGREVVESMREGVERVWGDMPAVPTVLVQFYDKLLHAPLRGEWKAPRGSGPLVMSRVRVADDDRVWRWAERRNANGVPPDLFGHFVARIVAGSLPEERNVGRLLAYRMPANVAFHIASFVVRCGVVQHEFEVITDWLVALSTSAILG